jgi:hypothetical protein
MQLTQAYMALTKLTAIAERMLTLFDFKRLQEEAQRLGLR